MATKYECDRCKKLIPVGREVIFIEDVNYDLCDSCLDSLYKWLRRISVAS